MNLNYELYDDLDEMAHDWINYHIDEIEESVPEGDTNTITVDLKGHTLKISYNAGELIQYEDPQFADTYSFFEIELSLDGDSLPSNYGKISNYPFKLVDIFTSEDWAYYEKEVAKIRGITVEALREGDDE